MYILKLNILVQSAEDLDLESELSTSLDEILKNKQGWFISTNSEEIGGDNYGQCSICGCWVSDHRKQDYIGAFSNGIKIGDRWVCDICLPEDHPAAF